MRVRILLAFSAFVVFATFWATALLSAQTVTPTPVSSPTAPIIVFSANGQPSEMYSDLYGVYRLYFNSDRNLPLTDRDRHYLEPSWSPDGTRIVYATIEIQDGDNPRATTIEVMDADGSNAQVLVTGMGERAPTWSPDGETIAYASRTENAIYLIDVDGSNQRLLLEGLNAASLDFSPDGEVLLVSAKLGDDPLYQPYLLNIEDPTLTPLFEEVTSIWDATWSPDGESIALAFTNGNIVFTDADGQNPRNLEFTGQWTFITDDVHHVSDLSWSPDGSQIAFILDSSRLQLAVSTPVPYERVGAQVAVVDLETGNINLVTYGFRNNHPDWRP